jgi:hypothetical protein
MGGRSIVAIAIVAAAIGGAAGSAVTLRLRHDSDAPARGTLVHLGEPAWLAAYTPQPFCVSLHHFCIVQPETGHPIALYTYVPHPLFREWGCEVRFDPEAEWTNQDGTVIRGLFTDPCGGSRYDGTGHRVFGPSPTDLDTFPVTVTADATIVDTRTLICGKPQLVDTTYRCQRAPLGD